MRIFSYVLGVIILVTTTRQSSMESLDDFLVYPVELTSRRDTRRELQRQSFQKFVEEKLVAQNQALEHIVKMTRSNQEYIKQLVENLSNKDSKPKMPEKIEVQLQSRRSFVDNDNALVNIGKNIPKYGNLLKDMILKEFRVHEDPRTLVEHSVATNARSKEQ